jgi:tetratricopeptide (TPR) repeat protein
LSGNVQRSAGQVRVNVQLADTETGAQLWSDSIEGDISDVLALQDLVTSRVGNTIAAEMIMAAVSRPAAHGRESEVADLILRARALELKPDSIANLRAVEALYRQILKIEPGNSNAMGRLSRCLALQAVNFSHELDAGTIRSKTIESYEYASRAKALDPNNTDIYSAIANYWRFQGDFTASMNAGQAWITLEPKNPRGYILLAYDKYFNVQPREVIDLLNQAVKLHPKILSVSESSHRSLGRAYFMLGDDEAAIHWLQMALQINPKSSFAYQWLALAQARKGDLEKARAAAAEVRRLNPDRKLSTEKGYANTPAVFDKWFDQVVIPAWQLAGLPQ